MPRNRRSRSKKKLEEQNERLKRKLIRLKAKEKAREELIKEGYRKVD